MALHLGNLRGDLPPRAMPRPCASSSDHAVAQPQRARRLLAPSDAAGAITSSRAPRFWRDESGLGNGRKGSSSSARRHCLPDPSSFVADRRLVGLRPRDTVRVPSPAHP